MNKTYRTVFNAAAGTWAVASELAKGRTKSGKTALAMAVAAMLALPAGAAFATDDEDAVEEQSAILRMAANSVSTSPIGVNAAVEDTYLKINTTSGPSAVATGGNAIAMGIQSAAGGGNAVALGALSHADGDRAVAVGSAATVVDTAQYGVAIGRLAQVTADSTQSMALGAGATVSAANSVALGASSIADKEYTVSVGSATQQRRITNLDAGTQDTDAVNVGQMNTRLSTKVDNAYVKVNGTTAATATVAGAIAIGNNASANATGAVYPAVAIGNDATATGNALAVGAGSNAVNRGVAIGGGTAASGGRSTAVGYLVSATGDYSTALGASAIASANQTVALGSSANATHAQSVALGDSSATDREKSVSVGSPTLQRQITNMAAGTAATDAVNVSQLEPVVTALGGGAAIDPTTGAVTGPTYTLANGGTQTTIGGAFTALDGALTTTNGNVSALTTRMDTAETDIGDLQAAVGSGSVGLVRQAGAGADLTVGKDTDGAAVNFAGTAGDRTLTGIKAGAVSATSTEAVNGSQLHGVS
ncbi:TPA: hypothetical protein SAY52_006551, partial [Burkholderia cenocepacia]|nr:hypothetical protein [Burkholderia cenocepacia]